jgi:hypothetical protein
MTHAPIRRWFHFSFSLRTLFVIVTLTAALSSAYLEARKAKRLEAENAFLEKRIHSLEKIKRSLMKGLTTARQRGYLERQMREPANQPLPAHWLDEEPSDVPNDPAR